MTTPRPPWWDQPIVDAEIRQQALEELNQVETPADAERVLAELREQIDDEADEPG